MCGAPTKTTGECRLYDTSGKQAVLFFLSLLHAFTFLQLHYVFILLDYNWHVRVGLKPSVQNFYLVEWAKRRTYLLREFLEKPNSPPLGHFDPFR